MKENNECLKDNEVLISSKKDNEVLISIKPMLFAGLNYYPKGGWEDFIGYFETIEEAMQYIEKDWKKEFFVWAHVVHDGKIVILWDAEDKWRNRDDDE